MTTPHIDAVIALTRLKGESELLQWLRATLDDITTQIISQRDVVILHQLQGRAQFLQSFLKEIDGSQELLTKLRNSKRTP